MLISEQYRELNKKLHEDQPDYGMSAKAWASQIVDLCKVMETSDLLDYGCGKGVLQAQLNLPIAEYDPAIPGKDAKPEPHDVVACVDVLEHVEPECLDDVLDDLKRVTRKAAYLVVANRRSGRTLADGRNAHLIQESAEWWLPRIQQRFRLSMFAEVVRGGMVIAYLMVCLTKET